MHEDPQEMPSWLSPLFLHVAPNLFLGASKTGGKTYANLVRDRWWKSMNSTIINYFQTKWWLLSRSLSHRENPFDILHKNWKGCIFFKEEMSTRSKILDSDFSRGSQGRACGMKMHQNSNGTSLAVSYDVTSVSAAPPLSSYHLQVGCVLCSLHRVFSSAWMPPNETTSTWKEAYCCSIMCFHWRSAF